MNPKNLWTMIIACMAAAGLSAVWLMVTGPGVVEEQVVSLYRAEQKAVAQQLSSQFDERVKEVSRRLE